MSWWGNFVERLSFCIVSGESPEAIRKLCLYTKFPHQEIRWNYGILHSDNQKVLTLKQIAKWLSVRLRTKWLWVWIPLLSTYKQSNSSRFTIKTWHQSNFNLHIVQNLQKTSLNWTGTGPERVCFQPYCFICSTRTIYNISCFDVMRIS